MLYFNKESKTVFGIFLVLVVWDLKKLRKIPKGRNFKVLESGKGSNKKGTLG